MTDGPSIPPPPPSGGSSSLVTRAINLLTKPATEWAAIDAEQASNGKLIGGYAAILAALAPIFVLLYSLITAGGMIFHFPMLLIMTLVLTYVLSLGVPVAVGFIMDALTPQLGGVKGNNSAMKLVIYSATGYWIGAIGLILNPWLWLLIGVGLAGYLLWVGTPILMKTTADKTPVFVGATVGIWVVVWSILNVVFGNILANMAINAIMGAARSAYGL
jgi:hypothetical protein